MIDFLEKYLILETVEQDITNAIKNHQVLYVNYKGNKNGAIKDQTQAGVRHFLPVALGLNEKGNMIARVYLTSRGIQTAGRNHTPDYGGKWKTIRVDRIHSVIPREGEKDFWKDPPDGFNENGDNSMKVIYALAQWDTISNKLPPKAKKIAGEPNELDRIPAGSKVVLKPKQEKPKQEPEIKPTPTPTPAPKPEPTVPTAPPPKPPIKGREWQMPKPTDIIQTKKPIKPVQPQQPTEPQPPDQTTELPPEEKPLAESWLRWMNKIVNT